MSALTKEEFLQIVGVYNKAINRLTEQAKKEGIYLSSFIIYFPPLPTHLITLF